MNRAQWDRWLAALESGEYSQIRGFLGSPGGHCCVGVLCEITPGVTKSTIDAGLTFIYQYGEGDGNIQVLPESLAGELGFIDGNVGLRFDRVPPEIEDQVLYYGQDDAPFLATATALNDNYNLDFRQIASVIRQSREYQQSE